MTVRKPLEQPAELKGVFGEGKSVVAVAPSAPPAGDDIVHGLFKPPAPANDAPSALVSRPDRDRASARPVTDEAQRRLYELRAQSRGLWTDSSDKHPAVVPQPKIEKLPRAVLGLSGPAPAEPSTRPVASLDSDAPTSPPPQLDELPSTPAAWSGNHSNRPTDVRRSLRPISMRPSEEPSPEMDHRSTPLVARPDEPLVSDDEATVVAPELIAAAALAAEEAEGEALPSAVAQAVQQGAAEAAHRAGKRRALLVLVACVVLIALGLLLGLWPTPWSGSKPAQEPAIERAPASSAAEPAAPTPPSAAASPDPGQPASPTAEARPQDAPPAAAQPASADAPQPSAAEAKPAPAEQPRAAAAAEQPRAAAPEARPIAAAPASVGEGLRMARAELRARNPGGAEAVLRPLLDANPEDHHIGELLVQALIDGRKGSEAAALAQRIIKKRPKRAVYRVLLGDAYRVQGAMNAATAAWREALELEPDNPEALRRLKQP